VPRIRHFLSCILLVSIYVHSLSAEVLCPRVTSEHNADTTDLKRFRHYERWKDKTGEELAIAVWQYLCSAETGLYHMNTVNEGPDPWGEYSTVRDPIKLLNIYNVGYCGIFGPVMDGVFQGVGFEDGRAFGVSGWNHCTTEVWYDGRWHYFDLDVRGALRQPDGSIASVAEARKNRNLWVSPSPRIQPFFPKDPDKARVFEIYRDSRIDNFYRWFQRGHTMDFRLRQGESLTRWWHPQDGRWHHQEAYNTGFVRRLLEQEPRGYKSNHPDFSIWTQGNGLWHYAPNLTNASTDFDDGIESAENLSPGSDGLILTEKGSGEAVFEFFTPWIIVPQVNRLDDPDDDALASVISLDASRPIEILVSLDHGKTWLTVNSIPVGESDTDLTRWVKGNFGFLLKLRASGRAGETILRRMHVDTWVQVAPISLPRLKSGRNRCCYEIGDRYGQATRPTLVQPNVADPQDLKKYAVEMPQDYDLQRKTSRIRGDLIVRLDAPPQTSIDWLTVGGCFNTYQNKAAERTNNRIAYAADVPSDFREIYQADVPIWVNHWRYQWDEDIRLPRPAKTVFVKYTGDPGLNVIRATLHSAPEGSSDTAIQITHGYRIGDQLHEQIVEMAEAGEYTVDVPGEVENEFIRMAVPSRVLVSQTR
jgi:hypothetical protein